MIYARSVRPVVRLLGAFAGVGLGTLARGIDAAGTALLRRI